MSEILYTKGQTARVAEPAAGRPHGRDLAPAFRLYVDEVGDPAFRNCDRLPRRFLSLTGVALRLDDAAETVAPELDRIKRLHFGAHPDDGPMVLHRREILDRSGPYNVLLKPDRAAAFDADLLGALERWPFTVFTAVLDKLTFRERHPDAQTRPEAYAHVLGALVRCYTSWLAEQGERGDVMGEARGGKDDLRLKDAYVRLMEDGEAGDNQSCLASRQLKLKNKSVGVPGLQLADLLAHPSSGALQAHNGFGTRPADFGGQVVDLLDLHKYARLRDGKVENMGLLWIPDPPA